MTDINRLSPTDEIENGDLLPIWDTSNGGTRKISVSQLKEWLEANYSKGSFIVQRSAPNITGFTTTLLDTNNNVHLILTPTAGFAAGTIKLPPQTSLSDQQEIIINTTHQITVLTMDLNGAVAISGEPTSMAADDWFRLKYDQGSQTWYRIG